MTLLYDHPCFLEHETGHHPERAQRLRQIAAAAGGDGPGGQCRRPEFGPCDRRRLARVHSPAYIDELWAFAKTGGGYIEGDTIVSPASYYVAQQAVASVCDAVERVIRGEDAPGPLPGPPAGPPRPGQPRHGVLSAQQRGGGGPDGDRRTGPRSRAGRRLGRPPRQWHAGRFLGGSPGRLPLHSPLALLSRQRRRRRDRRRARGWATTLNLPVRFGISRKEYLALFADRLQAFAAKIKPQLVLVSAGFDAHRNDPVGNLGLESEDFIALTDAVLDVAATSTAAGGWSASWRAATTWKCWPSAWPCTWSGCSSDSGTSRPIADCVSPLPLGTGIYTSNDMGGPDSSAIRAAQPQ